MTNHRLSLHFLLLICLIIPAFLVPNKHIALSLIKNNKDDSTLIATEMCIGSSFKQCFTLQLDFQTFHIWVINSSDKTSPQKHRFDPNDSTSFQVVKKDDYFLFWGRHLSGLKGKDQAIINPSSRKEELSLLFNVVNTPLTAISELVDGAIGLGYAAKDDVERRSSFINQLEAQNLINYEVFSIDFVDASKAKMYLGDYPSKLGYDYFNYGSCDLMYDTPTWQCASKETVIADKTPNTTQYKVVFQPNHQITSPPISLKDDIWSKLSSHSCKRQLNGNDEVFLCKNVEGDAYPSITIQVGYWVMTLPIGSLFTEGYEVLFSFPPSNNNWLLGYNYLRHFTLVFDRHNEKMGFYHTNWVKYIGNERLSKPSLRNHLESSMEPKQLPTEVKPTDSTVSFVFNLFMIITFFTVVAVVLALIVDFLKKANSSDTVLPFYAKNSNELFDVGRSSKIVV